MNLPVPTSKLPELYGQPIQIRFLPHLRAHRGRLLSGESHGSEVHAGSFLRKRQIVLDSELRRSRAEYSRVLVHELFHFTWLRLGNPRRRSYERLIVAELRYTASGELGWSADSRKLRLRANDRRLRSSRWREYVCESFCDSAAWLFAGQARNAEFTLPARWRRGRRRWFQDNGLMDRIPV